MADQTSPSSTSQTLSPENQGKLQNGLKLLGLKDLSEVPGSSDPAQVALFLEGLDNLIARHGEEWVTQNKVRLLEELQIVADNAGPALTPEQDAEEQRIDKARMASRMNPSPLRSPASPPAPPAQPPASVTPPAGISSSPVSPSANPKNT